MNSLRDFLLDSNSSNTDLWNITDITSSLSRQPSLEPSSIVEELGLGLSDFDPEENFDIFNFINDLTPRSTGEC